MFMHCISICISYCGNSVRHGMEFPCTACKCVLPIVETLSGMEKYLLWKLCAQWKHCAKFGARMQFYHTMMVKEEARMRRRRCAQPPWWHRYARRDTRLAAAAVCSRRILSEACLRSLRVLGGGLTSKGFLGFWTGVALRKNDGAW